MTPAAAGLRRLTRQNNEKRLKPGVDPGRYQVIIGADRDKQQLKGETMEHQIDHIEYPKRIRILSSDQLRFIIQDCREALAVMQNCIKSGYYADEINYCAMELNRREKGQI